MLRLTSGSLLDRIMNRCHRRMNREKINTALWMIICVAGTFCLIPITFTVIVAAHIISDPALEYVLWPLRLIFMASPFAAWLLGLQESLPGTRPAGVTGRSPNAISKILIPIVIIIGVCFTAGAWVAFLPQPGRPDIAITFLGYTNDSSGTRRANIAVTNLNPTTIFIYQPHIEIQAPNDARGYEDYFPGVNCAWKATLASGASDSFTIASPTNSSPWRLSCYVYPDRGRSAKNTIKNIVSTSCLSAGLWPLFARFLPLDGAFRMPYAIAGDWIQQEKRPAG